MTKKTKKTTKRVVAKKAVPHKAVRARKMVSLECACCTKFSAPVELVREAKSGLREIYCPRGHEISWNGGNLGRRQHSDKMLQREYETQMHFANNIGRALLTRPQAEQRLRSELKAEIFQELLDKV